MLDSLDGFAIGRENVFREVKQLFNEWIGAVANSQIIWIDLGLSFGRGGRGIRGVQGHSLSST